MAIDIKRTFIGREVGNKPVDPNTTFNAGMVGAINSLGNVVVCDSTATPAGILKWNKTSTVYGVEIDEAQVMNTDGTTAVNLNHANVSNVRVRSLAGGLGTLYASGTDYTLSTTNGTVTRLSAGGIASGATVFVTYTFQLTNQDITSGVNAPGNVGLNFNLNNDDTAGSGKIVLIQGLSTVFVDQFDTSRTYAVNDQLYVTSAGIFTNVNFSGASKFGKVISVPTASDPYLGVEGNLVADR
jgi:hypothetical protein